MNLLEQCKENLLNQCRENANTYVSNLQTNAQEVFEKLVPMINEKLIEYSKTNNELSFYLYYSSTAKNVVEYNKNLFDENLTFSKVCDDKLLLDKLDQYYTSEGFKFTFNNNVNLISISFKEDSK